jgi:flagellar hook-basal body complex protein FliE
MIKDPVNSLFGSPLPGTGSVRGAGASGGESFVDALKGFVGQVDQQIKEANQKADEFAVGKRFDMHEIVIATERADIGFRLLMQIRNKLLEAYQEIMRMQF